MNKYPNTVIKQTVCRITQKNQTDLYLERFSKMEGITTLLMTSYTDTVISPEGEKVIITDKASGKKTFIASKMIERDFLESGIVADEIPPSTIKFYQMQEKEFSYKNGILIDIKAAYPSILKSIELIKTETYEYLMTLKKIERLKAIGMLASKKIKIEIENNEYKQPEIIPAGIASQVYYIAAFEIGEILNKCKHIAKNNFLFFWFDGIYLSPDYGAAIEIMEYINSVGLQCTMKQISDINQTKNETGNFIFQWTEITPKVKTKKISLPNKPKNIFR